MSRNTANSKRLVTGFGLRISLLALAVSLILFCIYIFTNSSESISFTSDYIDLTYNTSWVLEDQSDTTGTYVCLTQGDAKTSKVGLVIEATSEIYDPNEMMDMYKTSFATQLQGQDMKIAAQSSYDKSWASLSGTCLESVKQLPMKFNVQVTATERGTFITTLMYEEDTSAESVKQANAIIDSIKQKKQSVPSNVTDKTLDQLTQEDLASMTWDEMETVMRKTFKYVTFKTVSYQDGAYMAITLDGTEPDASATERTSSAQGITFTQRLTPVSELDSKSLKDALQLELEKQSLLEGVSDFTISEISEAETQAQAAGIYSYAVGDIHYIGVTTYEQVNDTTFIANNILLDGTVITDESEELFKELCVLLQISITMEDIENAGN